MINVTAIRQNLKAEEGFRPHAYGDHLGYLTIGYGRMVDRRLNGGITREEAEYLLENDIGRVVADLRAALPWVENLPDGVAGALVEMGYQLGVPGLLKFKTMLGHIEAGRFQEAAVAARRSLWARQTPERAGRVAEKIESGA